MRWLALAVLGACSFSPGQLRGDGGGSTGDDATDGPGSDSTIDIDGSVDGMPPQDLGLVRSIDVVDAQVTGGPHTDFPMLVSLTASYLATKANGGEVENASGHDIFFSADQAGTQRLAHDVEVYAPTTGQLVAWVKIPALATTTVIYLHYGNPAITTSQENVAGTWTAYELVNHMDGTGDATGKASVFTGTNIGNTANGRFGPANTFNGTDSALQHGSDTEIDNIFTNGGTAEAWVNMVTYGEGSRARIFDKGEDAGWAFFVDNFNATGSITLIQGWTTTHGYWPASSNVVNTANWHHVVVTYDNASTAQDPMFIVNGVVVTTSENDSPNGNLVDDAANGLVIGNNPAGTRAFDGSLDELRLAGAPRTTGWIQTQYRNQSDPATFYAVSAPL